ncbi:hypothetical protein J6590_019533 [Homalodisca vitripennis]|nr:hypothetical protein J6590_019533 [Homalodisca vitripennis]
MRVTTRKTKKEFPCNPDKILLPNCNQCMMTRTRGGGRNKTSAVLETETEVSRLTGCQEQLTAVDDVIVVTVHT